MGAPVENSEIAANSANPNHPKSSDTIKVEPIRTVNAINNLKKHLADSPRNFALLGVDPRIIKTCLGHASLDTTMIYSHTEARARHEAIEKALSDETSI